MNVVPPPPAMPPPAAGSVARPDATGPRLTALAPSRTLLVLWGAVLGLSLLGPMGPPVSSLWAIALLIVVVAAAFDAWRGRRHPARIGASAASLGRFQLHHPSSYPLTLTGLPQGLTAIGLELPSGFQGESVVAEVEPDADGTGRVQFQLTGSRRGIFPAPGVRIAANSPWRLWEMRFALALPGELRVYPSLLRERRTAATLFLPSRRHGTTIHHFVGQGREFDRLREYQPGDAFADIHWKATARAGTPVTRLYQVERTQEIHLVIDASRLSARPVRRGDMEESALERTLAAALLLLAAAEQQGDRFGLSVFDDRIIQHLPAGNGSAHYHACREIMATIPPGRRTPDTAEILRDLRTRLRRRALILLLTDVTDPVLAEGLLEGLPLLTRRHLVLIGQLRSPGVQPVFAPPVAKTVPEVYGRLAGHLRHREFATLAKHLAAHRIQAHLLEDGNMAARLIEIYLEIKRRQLL